MSQNEDKHVANVMKKSENLMQALPKEERAKFKRTNF